MKTKKRVMKYYFLILGLFAFAFIIASGNKKVDIVTSNVNNVKSIQSTRIINKTTTFSPKTKLVTNTNDIKKYGNDYKLEFNGTLTGYGPDCPGCGGRVACRPNPDVRGGNIYFEDNEYGKIRILAADYSIPCGSIIKVSNFKFVENNEFYGVVLDRGSAIVGLTMDLLYPSEKDTKIVGRQRNINFKVERWGW